MYARSLGLAAYHGVSGDNDAIFYNPGALAAQKVFLTNLGGMMYRVGADTDATIFGGSVVDSASTTVAAGFSYNYISTLGYKTRGAFGGMTNLALAFPVGDNLFLGATGTYLNVYSDTATVSAITTTVGAFVRFGKLFSGGFTGYNLINTSHPDLLPLGMERAWPSVPGTRSASPPTGCGATAPTTSTPTGGPRAPRSSSSTWSRCGVAGCSTRATDVQLWSLGAGFSYSGFGAEFAYRQSFGGSTFRTLAAMIKFAVPGT